MKTAIFVTDREFELLDQALAEYEEKHYSSESEQWQKEINDLIYTIKKRGVTEK